VQEEALHPYKATDQIILEVHICPHLRFTIEKTAQKLRKTNKQPKPYVCRRRIHWSWVLRASGEGVKIITGPWRVLRGPPVVVSTREIREQLVTLSASPRL
jgi:hypothetical protein